MSVNTTSIPNTPHATHARHDKLHPAMVLSSPSPLCRFDCVIEKDGEGWYGWVSPLNEQGNITDEFITRRYTHKHGAVTRLREICRKMGLAGWERYVDEAEGCVM
jgi:hypothetical protein